MDYKSLFANIVAKQSFLCVGLDSDMALLPASVTKCSNPVFEFNKAIIDATAQYTVAYKPNLAFYECLGWQGWRDLELTVNYIRKNYPDMFLIADAKRGDIGNTAAKYAEAFFNHLDFDAVTISPYMGRESVEPFLKIKGKWVIILALTSNPSAADFETLNLTDYNIPLYQKVIKEGMEWGSADNIMFVAGATRPLDLAAIRGLCPHNFLLVPGIGAQGGSVKEISKNALNSSCGVLANASRSVIFAFREYANGEDGISFQRYAAESAASLAFEMKQALIDGEIILPE